MTRAELIRQLEAEGFVVVPAEPTVEMVEAGFRGGRRNIAKYFQETIELWRPRAGSKHPHEPGLVSAIREAIKAGAIKE